MNTSIFNVPASDRCGMYYLSLSEKDGLVVNKVMTYSLMTGKPLSKEEIDHQWEKAKEGKRSYWSSNFKREIFVDKDMSDEEVEKLLKKVLHGGRFKVTRCTGILPGYGECVQYKISIDGGEFRTLVTYRIHEDRDLIIELNNKLKSRYYELTGIDSIYDPETHIFF